MKARTTWTISTTRRISTPRRIWTTQRIWKPWTIGPARVNRIHRRALLPVALGLLMAAPAHAAQVDLVQLAYVDPGAGSFILQALVASIAGAAVAVSAYWRRIKRFLGIGSSGDDADHEDRTSTDE
jgi:hypothetical protein